MVNSANHDDCIFCKIISGAIPSCKVYENEQVISFLDLAPTAPGHSLVVPKEHYINMLDMPKEMGSAVFEAINKVGRALMSTTDVEGFNVLQNNFSVAGQIVMHAHWHIVPRRQNDGLTLWQQGSYKSNDEMAELAARLFKASCT